MRAAGVVLWMLAAAGCKSKPDVGDACAVVMPSALCHDDHSELLCENDHYIAVPCRGSGGCSEGKSDGMFVPITCDISDNVDGDRCLRSTKLGKGPIMMGGDDGTGACSSDRSAIVVCHDGKLVREWCPPSTKCVERAGSLSCAQP